jgi:hypothetical protein
MTLNRWFFDELRQVDLGQFIIVQGCVHRKGCFHPAQSGALISEETE